MPNSVSFVEGRARILYADILKGHRTLMSKMDTLGECFNDGTFPVSNNTIITFNSAQTLLRNQLTKKLEGIGEGGFDSE